MNTSPDLPGLNEEHVGKPLNAKTVDVLAGRLGHSPINREALDGANVRCLQYDLLQRDPHLQRVLQQILERASISSKEAPRGAHLREIIDRASD